MEAYQDVYQDILRVYCCKTSFVCDGELNFSLLKDSLPAVIPQQNCLVIGGRLASPIFPKNSDDSSLTVWYLLGFQYEPFISKMVLYKFLPNGTTIDIISRKGASDLIEGALSESTELLDVRVHIRSIPEVFWIWCFHEITDGQIDHTVATFAFVVYSIEIDSLLSLDVYFAVNPGSLLALCLFGGYRSQLSLARGWLSDDIGTLGYLCL